MSGLSEEYGPGMYDIYVAAMLDGEMETTSVHSICYRTEPSGGYGDR